MSAPGWSMEGDLVVLRMSERDYWLLVSVMMNEMLAAKSANCFSIMRELLGLMDRINAGNPTYPRPPGLPEEVVQ